MLCKRGDGDRAEQRNRTEFERAFRREKWLPSRWEGGGVGASCSGSGSGSGSSSVSSAASDSAESACGCGEEGLVRDERKGREQRDGKRGGEGRREGGKRRWVFEGGIWVKRGV